MGGLLDTPPIGRAKNRLFMHLSYKVFEVCWLDNIIIGLTLAIITATEIWLVVLRLNVPVNNFSVMSGRSHRFLGN